MQRLQNIALVLGYTSAVSISRGRGGRGGGDEPAEPVEPFNGLDLGGLRVSEAFAAADADESGTLDCQEIKTVWTEYADDGRTNR